MADESDPVWDQRNDVRYKAWVQYRYHRRRQRFFDLVDKWTKVATVVLGGTILSRYQDKLGDVGAWSAVAISALGLLGLVFGYTDRKQTHKELAEAAAALAEKVERVPAGQLTSALTAGWKADFLALCAKAPPTLKTLTLICEREQSTADGHPNHIAAQSLPARLLSHFV